MIVFNNPKNNTAFLFPASLCVAGCWMRAETAKFIAFASHYCYCVPLLSTEMGNAGEARDERIAINGIKAKKMRLTSGHKYSWKCRLAMKAMIKTEWNFCRARNWNVCSVSIIRMHFAAQVEMLYLLFLSLISVSGKMTSAKRCECEAICSFVCEKGTVVHFESVKFQRLLRLAHWNESARLWCDSMAFEEVIHIVIVNRIHNFMVPKRPIQIRLPVHLSTVRYSHFSRSLELPFWHCAVPFLHVKNDCYVMFTHAHCLSILCSTFFFHPPASCRRPFIKRAEGRCHTDIERALTSTWAETKEEKKIRIYEHARIHGELGE